MARRLTGRLTFTARQAFSFCDGAIDYIYLDVRLLAALLTVRFVRDQLLSQSSRSTRSRHPRCGSLRCHESWRSDMTSPI